MWVIERLGAPLTTEQQDDQEYSKEELDNHSNQLNPNNDAYWQSRGGSGRPGDDED